MPRSRRHRPLPADPLWDVARGVALTPHQPDACAGADAAVTVRARRHPTGWFIRATHRPGLPPAALAHLREFAIVRTFLLLRHGPQPSAWEPGPTPDEWVARTDLDAPDYTALVPDTVPAGW